jgi:superfamily II DNA or RNA helicase
MSVNLVEEKAVKQLYPYQQNAIEQITKELDEAEEGFNLLYQLPTGGGKTVIFSEIAKQFIERHGKKVLILTHRIELCTQTSNMLTGFDVKNMVFDSKIKHIPFEENYDAFVAMVETLNNRLRDTETNVDNIGLVIIDEAHYNSFRKLFKYFEKANILGVTATPLSSNMKLPMKDSYDRLLVGESISSLIKNKYLANAITHTLQVNLSSLKIGANGDYTVASSERLYGNFIMQEKLLNAYEDQALGKKTLIFNNGIQTSKHVLETFRHAGYDVRHLDNTHTGQERRDIINWFKVTPNAVLSSVGILTTGFDEPTVETIILNRATKSLTLYYQMIGRGSRIIPGKHEFQVIDLGNNVARFGVGGANIDWQRIFRSPLHYLNNIMNDDDIQRNFVYVMPDELREKFIKTKEVGFDMEEAYKQVIHECLRPKVALERSIEQQADMCIENAEDLYDALDLTKYLKDDIASRLKKYTYCICNSTPNYLKWLLEDYNRKLEINIRNNF